MRTSRVRFPFIQLTTVRHGRPGWASHIGQRTCKAAEEVVLVAMANLSYRDRDAEPPDPIGHILGMSPGQILINSL
jgi:hypothetical protein